MGVDAGAHECVSARVVGCMYMVCACVSVHTVKPVSFYAAVAGDQPCQFPDHACTIGIVLHACMYQQHPAMETSFLCTVDS